MRFIRRMPAPSHPQMNPLPRRADLHLHTTFSDGTERPERVVELARSAGVSAMAITDHDNVEALPIAAPVASRYGIELIPGIEMSASAEESEVHVLGFFFDPHNDVLRRHLAEQQARRVERVHEMVRRLQGVGVKIEAAEVLQLAGEGTVGRPHVARILLKHGYVSAMAEAFTKYLGPKNPGFVPGSILSPAHVIGVLRAAGGVPVLAHPVYLKRDELIDGFVRDGLAGLEVYHSSHTPEVIARYQQIADRLHLLKTGGSDFHGDSSKEGLSVGASTVAYEAVEALRAWKTTHGG